MNTPLPLTSDLFVRHAREIEKAAQRAVREALRDHKRNGRSIVVARDGKVVIVPPEEIDVPDEPEDE